MSFRSIGTGLVTIAVSSAFLYVGCGGGDSSPTRPAQPTTPTPTPTPPPAPTVSRIEVSPNMVSLDVGRTQQLVATAKASDGAVISGVNYTWSSSNTAVVSISAGGLATAVSVGTATIRATGNGVVSEPVTITVTVAAVARVMVAPSSAQEMMVGAMMTFTAMARTAGGAIRDDVSITWSSSDTSVVTITSAGVATAVAAGTATIRAAADGVTSSPVTINVSEPPPPAPVVSSVTVSPPEAMIEVGATQPFEAMAMTSDGMEVPDAEFTWSSSDEMVATVDADGLATGVGAGEAMITATADSVSGMATLMVTEPPPPEPEEPVVATVTVSPSETTIEEGDTQQFAAMALTSEGMEVPDAEFTWSSSDEMVATVEADGLATGVGAGEAIITATADGISGMATLTVTEPPPPEPVVASVAVSPTSMQITVGGMFQFMAVAMTADGMVIDDVEFTWMSDDTEVATVEETGLVTAQSAGTAMITATGNGVTSMPATVTVEDLAPVIASITIMDAMPVMLEVGDTHQLMAVARTSEGNMIGGVMFEWSSDDNEAATVDSTGLITAVAAGMADITAMAEEVTSEPVSVTVAEPPPVVDRVAVEPSSESIEEGEIRRFSATAYTSDDEEISGKTFSWTSSNPSVATISTTGLARARNAGSTTITATVDGKSGTATLRVTEPPPPPPPMLRSRTASISGGYSAAGRVVLSEVAGGRLNLTITGLKSTAPDTWLALSENPNIDWAVGETLPSTARSFGKVSDGNFTRTFTPPSGKDIDSYDYVILYCRAFDLRISSNSLSN